MLAVSAFVFLKPGQAPDPTAEKVREAIVPVQLPHSFGQESQSAEKTLLALGDRAYPELRRILRWRPSAFRFARTFVLRFLPAKLRGQRLAADVTAERLQRQLDERLYSLGPATCRAMAGAISDALDTRDGYRDVRALLRALSWSVPESPRATLMFSNYFSRSIGATLFIGRTAEEFWPKVPQFALLLADSLTNADVVAEAAVGLATFGTNAAFGVPLLVQAAENGVAGRPPNLAVRRTMAPVAEAISDNRACALQALAKIGVTDSEVVRVIRNCVGDPDPVIAMEAVITALALSIPIDSQLNQALENWRFDARTLGALENSNEKLRRIGRFGRRGRAAIALLNRVANGEALEAPPDSRSPEARAAQQLQFTAVRSLVQIEPEQARPFLQMLLTNFASWDAAETLCAWKDEKDEIVKILSEKLRQPPSRDIAAYILASLDPANVRAREILYQAAQRDEGWEQYSQAAALGRLWQVTRDTGFVFPIARALLQHGTYRDQQNVIALLGQMGSAARRAVPELQILLKANFWDVRDRAGELLRKIAPEQMPPIVD